MTSRRRILCVNIPDDIRSLFAANLNSAELVSVRSDDAAIVETRRTNFDLYLLNDSVGDRTGLQLCSIICTLDPTALVLVLTDNHLISQKDVQSAGAFGVVSQRQFPLLLFDALRILLE